MDMQTVFWRILHTFETVGPVKTTCAQRPMYLRVQVGDQSTG